MKPSGIGGQAVIEGVMMKNGNKYAVAVRKPNNEIVVETKNISGSAKRNFFLNLPIIRGVAAFVDSLSLGMKCLTFSASFYEEEEESKFEKKFNEVTKGKGDSILNGLTIILAVILAVGIFVILPMLLAEFLSAKIENGTVLAVIEGVLRLLIFILYIVLISRLKDIQRLFMYHGAEHKSINCIENELPLTVENVRKQSREHKRCGTSFMLTVMVISIIFFMFIRVENTLLRLGVRVLLIPVIAGISYEFIKLAGRSESKFVNFLSRPGMWLQALTTREPDDAMIEVAIQSVEAVFDWKRFIGSEDTKKTKKDKNSKSKKNSKNAAGKKDKTVALATEEVAVTAENPEEEPMLKEAVVEKTEVEDVAQLFDMKLTCSSKKGRKRQNPKKDPMPEATKVVSESKEDEDDDVLKALNMYFEFKGPKSVMEISDEETEESDEGSKK